MSGGDVTIGFLKRLSWLPDRDASDNGTLIGGQEYYDVEFTGGAISNVTLTDVTINGVATARNERVITAPGDVTVLSDDYIITMNKTVPQITTITLPATPTTSRTIIVKDNTGDAAAFNITIDGNGKTIDGSSTVVLDLAYQSFEIVYNGTQWNVLNRNRAQTGGSVNGPLSSTDNALVRWDGISGTVIQDSNAILTNTGDLSLAGTITASNFTGSSSGTNTGDQTITLTGDVTGSGTGSFAATISNNAVTYAKIQDVSATDRILGRSTAGSGDIEEIVCTAAGRNLLDDANNTAQRTTLGLGSIATQSAASVTITGGTFSGGVTFKTGGNVTIATGVLTVARGSSGVVADTEGSAATDDLDSIVFSDGNPIGFDVMVVRSANASRDITFKHGVGNILCEFATDFTLSSTNELAVLIGRGPNSWLAMKITESASDLRNRLGFGTTFPMGATIGGTAQSTYTTGDTLYASASNTLSKLAAGTNGYIYQMVAGVPAWVDKMDVDWTSYTPTMTAFGTVSSVSFKYRRIGYDLEVVGKFTSGTTTASEARISLPGSLTLDAAKMATGLNLLGNVTTNVAGAFSTVITGTGGNAYVTFGNQTAIVAGATAAPGNTFATGNVIICKFSVPCTGW